MSFLPKDILIAISLSMNVTKWILFGQLLFLISCQTAKKHTVLDVSPKSIIRGPASTLQCSKLFSEFENTEIIENFPDDIGFTTQLNSIKKQLNLKGQNKPVVQSSEIVAKFREKYLPYFKIDSTRESIVKWMEAELRLKSLALKNKIKTTQDPGEYDVVIVGTGVHGIIALHALLAQNSSLRILIIDSSDTGGATFRYAGDTFNINSSSRPSGPNSLPLPGRGNINELPALPIQVSDISPVKYPSAGDLGSALVAGLYSGVSHYNNVDILLNTEATAVFRENKGNAFKYGLDLKLDHFGKKRVIKTQKVIVSTGLGTPQVPEGISKAIRKYPELINTEKIDQKLPRVMTFEDVMRVISKSNDPKKYFQNKKIAVVGVGDSANVFIEFLLGYASRLGYGQSDGQTAGPKKVYWIGQLKETCEEFISDIRSRYSQLGTGYRSSDPNSEPIITGIPPKLSDIIPRGKNKATAVLSEPTTNGVSSLDVDIVILATGFKGGLTNLFSRLFPEKIIDPKKTQKDSDFIEEYFSFLELNTSTSNNTKTRVAKYAKRFDSIGRTLVDEQSVFVVGPSAGKLPKDNELVGIIQNSVSIFNNAPRTSAAGAFIANSTKQVAKSNSNIGKIILKYEKEPLPYKITGLSEVRNIGNTSQPYLFSVAKSIGKKIDLENLTEAVEVEFSKKHDGIVVVSHHQVKLKNLVEAFIETRDFFNILDQVLLYNPGLSFFLRLEPSGSVSVSFSQSTVKRYPKYRDVKNKSVSLRGIE